MAVAFVVLAAVPAVATDSDAADPVPMTYYVDGTNGNDTYGGTLETVNKDKTDGPLKTLEAAKDRAIAYTAGIVTIKILSDLEYNGTEKEITFSWSSSNGSLVIDGQIGTGATAKNAKLTGYTLYFGTHANDITIKNVDFENESIHDGRAIFANFAGTNFTVDHCNFNYTGGLPAGEKTHALHIHQYMGVTVKDSTFTGYQRGVNLDSHSNNAVTAVFENNSMTLATNDVPSKAYNLSGMKNANVTITGCSVDFTGNGTAERYEISVDSGKAQIFKSLTTNLDIGNQAVSKVNEKGGDVTITDLEFTDDASLEGNVIVTGTVKVADGKTVTVAKDSVLILSGPNATNPSGNVKAAAGGFIAKTSNASKVTAVNTEAFTVYPDGIQKLDGNVDSLKTLNSVYAEGQTVVVTAVAKDGYKIDYITVNDEKVDAKNGVFSFTMRGEKVILNAVTVGAYSANLKMSYLDENGDRVTETWKVISPLAPNDKIFMSEHVPDMKGYTFSRWYVDEACSIECGQEVVVGNSNITLYADMKELFDITVNVNDKTKGTATVDTDSAVEGTPVTIILSPATIPGKTFIVYSVMVGDEKLEVQNSNNMYFATYTISGDTVFDVVFKETFSVKNETKDTNGTVTVPTGKVVEGEKVTFTAVGNNDTTKNIQYGVDTIEIKNGNQTVPYTKNADGSYSFTMPSANVTVKVTFAAAYKVTITPPSDNKNILTVALEDGVGIV